MNISSSGVLNIVAATYGLKDVTAQVAALVNRNAAPQTLSVAANNATFTDTWPNHAKVLTVVYRYDDGATRTVAAKEGATLSVGATEFAQADAQAGDIAATGPVLTIWGASYGPVDVTAKVQGLVQQSDQTLNITANNATFTDTWPNNVKTLVVVASYTGQVPFIDIVVEGSPYALRYRPHLQVLSAFWGLQDVTGILQANVRQRHVSLPASNAVFGDGWPGNAKTLCVVFQYADYAPQSSIIQEGGTLTIDYTASTPAYTPPVDPAALNIIAASYGRSDVTAKVAGLVSGQALNITANNATFGDSWPNVAKSFVAVYSWGSAAISSTVVREGQPVALTRPEPAFAIDQNFVSMAGLFATGDEIKLSAAAGGFWQVGANQQIVASAASSAAAETFTLSIPGAAGSPIVQLRCSDGSYVQLAADGTLHAGGSAQNAANLVPSLQSNGALNLGIAGGAPFVAVDASNAIVGSGNYSPDFSTCFSFLFNPTQAGLDNHLKAFVGGDLSTEDLNLALVKVIWDLTGGCFLAIGLGPLIGNADRLGPGVYRLLEGYPSVMRAINGLVATVGNNRTASAGALLTVLVAVYEAGVFMPLLRLVLSMAGWWALSMALVTILTKVLGGAASAGATVAAELITSFAIWAYQTTMDVLAYVASTSAGAAFLIAQDDRSAAPSPLLEA
ncbi:hypothetical protein Xmlh_20825 [Xanthomonas axonopodis pv. melhusii]|uniref:Uncharacterized protein n=1 Tax=Xanthomonas axonopodis pv. melhusii TaxID=487834 RepID=A0A1T1NPA9_9XANT|nr:hypothetical protein [Xanthomonas axonopodis]OOW65214.1 hypothetical protein Xmlh_20825 [Xanthomonas axonopodis pv. melhusii]